MSLLDRANHLGFKLLAELYKRQHDENLLFSPASITLALMVVYKGAQGYTREAIETTLGLAELSQDDINDLATQLHQQLKEPIKQVELSVANSLWLKEGLDFSPAFLELCQDNNDAELRSLGEGVDQINTWVSEKTKGKIDNIINTIDPLTVLILMNAIYFKGTWSEKFFEWLTKDQDFHVSKEKTIKHPMMRKTLFYRYFETERFQAIALPYGDGRTSMYVFLPTKSSNLTSFIKTIKEQIWDKWMASFKSEEVEIILPRFEYKNQMQLADILTELNMGIAFDKHTADFTGMFSTPPEDNVYINHVEHQACITVNEEGTEAAAATIDDLDDLSDDEPIRMIVNRPFYFAIRDNQSRTVLFMGIVVNPSLGEI